jgi:hypothetical protein
MQNNYSTIINFTLMRTSCTFGTSTIIFSIDNGDFGFQATAARQVIGWKIENNYHDKQSNLSFGSA